jgi:hypothetical protein
MIMMISISMHDTKVDSSIVMQHQLVDDQDTRSIIHGLIEATILSPFNMLFCKNMLNASKNMRRGY